MDIHRPARTPAAQEVAVLKLTFLTALSVVAVALALPSMAAAAHHSRSHHSAHHVRSRHHSHHKAAAVSTASAPVVGGQSAIVRQGEGTSTSPATTPPPAPAATVTSFTGGVLTITLAGGGTQSGMVSEETRIECIPATGPASTEGDGEDSGQSSGASVQPDAVHPLAAQSHGDEQGQDGQQEGQDGSEGTPCTSAALTPGAVVRVAELNVTSAGAVWDRIEIAR